MDSVRSLRQRAPPMAPVVPELPLVPTDNAARKALRRASLSMSEPRVRVQHPRAPHVIRRLSLAFGEASDERLFQTRVFEIRHLALWRILVLVAVYFCAAAIVGLFSGSDGNAIFNTICFLSSVMAAFVLVFGVTARSYQRFTIALFLYTLAVHALAATFFADEVDVSFNAISVVAVTSVFVLSTGILVRHFLPIAAIYVAVFVLCSRPVFGTGRASPDLDSDFVLLLVVDVLYSYFAYVNEFQSRIDFLRRRRLHADKNDVEIALSGGLVAFGRSVAGALRLPVVASALHSTLALNLTTGSAEHQSVRDMQQKLADESPAWAVKFSELKLAEVIGQGSFGTVYKASWRGTTVAVKMINRTVTDHDFQEFIRELSLMVNLRHPNVTLFMGVCLHTGNDGGLSLITEYMSCGSLANFLYSDKPHYYENSDWVIVLKMASDVARGMSFLHGYSPAILHLDLKGANILVDSSLTAKVADFGLSRVRRSMPKEPSLSSLQPQHSASASGQGSAASPLPVIGPNGQTLRRGSSNVPSTTSPSGQSGATGPSGAGVSSSKSRSAGPDSEVSRTRLYATHVGSREQLPLIDLVGTPGFMAPELAQPTGQFTEKCDVFSFGIVLWEMANGRVPHKGIERMAVILGTMKGLRPQVPDDMPKVYAELMTECWDQLPRKRPSFPVVLTRLEDMARTAESDLSPLGDPIVVDELEHTPPSSSQEAPPNSLPGQPLSPSALTSDAQFSQRNLALPSPMVSPRLDGTGGNQGSLGRKASLAGADFRAVLPSKQRRRSLPTIDSSALPEAYRIAFDSVQLVRPESNLESEMMPGVRGFRAAWKGAAVSALVIPSARTVREDLAKVNARFAVCYAMYHPGMVRFLGASRVSRGVDVCCVFELHGTGRSLHNLLYGTHDDHQAMTTNLDLASSFNLDYSPPAYMESLKFRQKLITGLAQAILYLSRYEPSIEVGPISSRDVFVDESGVPKLGPSVHLRWIITQEHGLPTMGNHLMAVPVYTPPELLRPVLPFEQQETGVGVGLPTHSWGDQACLVYNMGILIYEILTSSYPHSNRPDLHPLDLVASIINEGLRPVFVEVPDPDVRGLLRRCWEAAPADRPSLIDVINEFQSACEGDDDSTNLGTTIESGGISGGGGGGGSGGGGRNGSSSTSMVQWGIKPEDFTLGEKIGEGSAAEVYLAEWRQTEVAIKKFRLVAQSHNSRQLMEFRRETKMMSELRHPNVLLFIGASCIPPDLFIVTEHMRRGSLEALLADPSVEFDGSLILSVAKDTARGMHYLHCLDPPLIHRDLKSSNILIDSFFTAKVADFGVSRIRNDAATMSQVGTIKWTAPEVLRGDRYSEKADIYSFAIILWELLYRTEPYPKKHTVQVAMDVSMRGLRPEFDTQVEAPDEYKSLAEAAWHELPSARPSFGDILAALAVMGSTAFRAAACPKADPPKIVRKKSQRMMSSV